MLHVTVVSGSRADYGPLRPLLLALRADGRFRSSIVACTSGRSDEGRRQLDAFAADGLSVDAHVDLAGGAPHAAPVTRLAADALAGVSAALERLAPDVVLVLGDRSEIAAVALGAHLLRIPIIHLSGGDETLGSLDDAMRHAISRLASLHFPTNEESAGRLRALGIPAERIVIAGNTALDDLVRHVPRTVEDLAEGLSVPLLGPIAVLTYHPATLVDEPPVASLRTIVEAIRAECPDVSIVITEANADTGGTSINAEARRLADADAQTFLVPSLGPERYWSLLHHAVLVVGNSSSALIEAPVIGVPVVDVGERQASRLRAASCIHATVELGALRSAIAIALERPRTPEASPYGDGHAVPRVLDRLAAIGDARSLLVPVPLKPVR